MSKLRGKRPRRLKVALRGKVIGTFDLFDLTFRKNVRKSRHFQWSLKAWGIDRIIFNALGKRGCQNIIIRDRDSGDVYSADYGHFKVSGIERDFGHGVQLFLQDMFWNIKRKGDEHPQLFIEPVLPAPRTSEERYP